MTLWLRLTSGAGIVLGGAGLLYNCWNVVAVFGRAPIVFWQSLFGFAVAPLFGIAVWLVRKRPDHPQVRRLLLFSALTEAFSGFSDQIRTFTLHSTGGWVWLANLVVLGAAAVAVVTLMVMMASFPDGVVERRWQRVALRLAWLQLVWVPLWLLSSPTVPADLYVPDLSARVPNPFAVHWLAWLSGPAEVAGRFAWLLLFPILWVRFLQANPELRTRMRLLAYGTAVTIPIYLLLGALASGVAPAAPVWYQLLIGAAVVLMLALLVIIVVGIVRHRLFDIDVAVRRSVVFGLLSLGIAVVYFGLAAAPGLALGNRIPVEYAVVMTILAAAVFQPLRRRLDVVVDRLVFGERVNRYQLLTAFGARLEQTDELNELVPRLADAVHRGLATEWVRVTLPGASASSGLPVGAVAMSVPLQRSGEVVGHIECGPKNGGFHAGDQELLSTLAGQAATAITNVQLTARLAEQVAELGRSRARIVAAQDAERRRIERDIHDGAQQHVVALIMKTRLARNQLARGERAAEEVLGELQHDTQELLTDLRELAHGIHPPVLSDQGLVPAVQARADRLPLPVRVHADAALRGTRFETKIEGAAYFIVCEALTNVVKHAGARLVDISLSAGDGYLAVKIHDDGRGMASTDKNGHGLTNLRDRVETLNGRLRIDSEPDKGTTVHAELPNRDQ
ncbi:sensor histidine kinase [Amycolatopsis sp. H20-H5]|uniref:sensor histidine kinase n=1 Tax=Amycolatopsis sp. H20-H5 TaxID=3046309 RepID=UPI002DBB045B|nr:GAF domain-containing sensor histidine kinase [Amycolatopsis sp. H20-H5]MEC3976656.1 GAF domain-containing sensor histidine kinase [Amycolatopsis sp. H20-H5]